MWLGRCNFNEVTNLIANGLHKGKPVQQSASGFGIEWGEYLVNRFKELVIIFSFNC